MTCSAPRSRRQGGSGHGHVGDPSQGHAHVGGGAGHGHGAAAPHHACPKHHTLVTTAPGAETPPYRGTGWSCDKCGETGSVPRLHCNKCAYDLCGACAGAESAASASAGASAHAHTVEM